MLQIFWILLVSSTQMNLPNIGSDSIPLNCGTFPPEKITVPRINFPLHAVSMASTGEQPPAVVHTYQGLTATVKWTRQ